MKYALVDVFNMNYSASAETQKRIVFTSAISSGKSSENSAILLAESVRAYAGTLSKSPIWYYVPFNGDELSFEAEERLLALDVDLITFKVDQEASKFFFVPEVVAAAEAEEMAQGKTDVLAWLGSNTVVLQEPRDFLLPGGKNVGYRPVHHTLVGSRFGEPLDPFWRIVYERCGVKEDRVFPMQTHVDGETIRPYLNAGLLVTRPEKRLIQRWRDSFLSIYRETELERIYKTDSRYRIFIHQAVLSGITMASFSCSELLELPPTYNYPIHLYDEDTTGHRPRGLEELVTFRHEEFYKDPDWEEKMPAGEPLKRWIAEKLLI